jgi:hypothetical protein
LLPLFLWLHQFVSKTVHDPAVPSFRQHFGGIRITQIPAQAQRAVLLPSSACLEPTVNPQQDLYFSFLWSKRLAEPLNGYECSINTRTTPLCSSIFEFQNFTLADFMFCVLLFSYQKPRSSSPKGLVSPTQAQWHRLQCFLSGPTITRN